MSEWTVAELEGRLKKLVRPVAGFPNPDFVFGDITPLLADPPALTKVVETLVARYRDAGLAAVAAPEARGFFFGPPLALGLGVPFVPIRKHGQLPGPSHTSEEVNMDYGSRVLEVHDATVSPSSGKVVIIDDILATGGSALACVAVLRRLGLEPVEVAVVYDYSEGASKLDGKRKLEDAGVPVFKLATFCRNGDMRWWLERGPEDDVVVSPHMGKIHKQH